MSPTVMGLLKTWRNRGSSPPEYSKDILGDPVSESFCLMVLHPVGQHGILIIMVLANDLSHTFESTARTPEVTDVTL